MTTQAEQYLLELINRGRLDPLAEAERYGIDLNQGLSAGTISSEAKQVLAHSDDLEYPARLHSQWMLQANVFSHTGEGGSTLRQRVEASDYELSGSWRIGENLSWRGTTGVMDLDAQIDSHHQGLFLSSGHRKNLMQSQFREIGIAQEEGLFFYDGINWNSSMVTQKFGKSGNDIFVTGVVFDDLDGDDFFSIGEGRSGAAFSVANGSVFSGSSGGYEVAMAPSAEVVVSITYGSFEASVLVEPGGENVKIDLVDGNRLLLSKSATLLSGVSDAGLLGRENLDLTGGVAADKLNGNEGDNVLIGDDGADTISGGGGADLILGGDGSDALDGDAGDDRILSHAGDDIVAGGADNDVLYGGSGRDNLSGEAGNDRLFGGGGSDNLDGGEGNDLLFGGPTGDDTLTGGGGADMIFGEGGDDILAGGAGADFMNAGSGNDTITGGTGDDIMSGGAGSDTFVFADGFGSDQISDFDARDDAERIDLSAVFGITGSDDLFTNHIQQTGSDVVVFDGSDSITLQNVHLSNLHADDFIFV